MNTELIKKTLEKAGMTQRKFASECGISREHMNYVINGDRLPSIPLLRRMSDILGVTADELIRGGDE